VRNSRECGKSSPLNKITHLAKNNKQAGFRGGKTHTKSYALNHSTSLWLTTILHVSSIEPTLPHITHRTMSTALAMHIVPRQQPQQARKTTNERRRTEVVFFPPTNRFSDLSPYNRLLVIQHCSVISLSFFSKKFQSDNICFYYTVIFLFFLVCFFFFFGFFSDSVIYFFVSLHLCIYFSSSFGNFVSGSI
jgi:hypothetical protein